MKTIKVFQLVYEGETEFCYIAFHPTYSYSYTLQGNMKVHVIYFETWVLPYIYRNRVLMSCSLSLIYQPNPNPTLTILLDIFLHLSREEFLLTVDCCNTEEHLESSWRLVYYQVSGEPRIARCSCQSDIYLRECVFACKLIHWSSPHNFIIFVVGLDHKF